jgi:hypothetical protein
MTIDPCLTSRVDSRRLIPDVRGVVTLRGVKLPEEFYCGTDMNSSTILLT